MAANLNSILAEIKKSNKKLDAIEKTLQTVDKRLTVVEKGMDTLNANMELVLECVPTENAGEFKAIKRGSSSRTVHAIAAKAK